MATLIVRRVEERLVEALKERARRHGRSAEAEHRAILEAELARQAPSTEELLAYFRRGAALGLGEVGPGGGGPVEPPNLGLSRLILLDTNVVSELAKPRPSRPVLAWLAEREPASLFLSAVTLGEIDVGARAHPDPGRRAKLVDWCDGLQNVLFRDRVLPFDAGAARVWGGIVDAAKRQGRTLAWRYSQIAATAARFGARLATRNVRHFAGLGVELVDPFVAPD